MTNTKNLRTTILSVKKKKSPFFEDLRVGLDQIIRNVITCQILEGVSSQSLNLKNIMVNGLQLYNAYIMLFICTQSALLCSTSTHSLTQHTHAHADVELT